MFTLLVFFTTDDMGLTAQVFYGRLPASFSKKQQQPCMQHHNGMDLLRFLTVAIGNHMPTNAG